MYRKFYKKKFKHKLLLGFFIGLGVAVFLVFLTVTPVGNAVFKKIIEYKIDRYVPDTEITYLDYGVNNFSLVAKKGWNLLKMYGQMFPFNAIFDCDFKKIQQLTPEFRGNMNLSGKIYTYKDKIIIKGLSFFAKGYMNFKADVIKNGFDLKAQGSDLNLAKVLYMLKIDYPWLNGQTDVNLTKNGSLLKAVFNTSGVYDRKIKTEFKAVSKAVIKNKAAQVVSDVKSGIGNIKITAEKHSYDNWEFRFNAVNINLSKLKPLLLYPFHGNIGLKGVYELSSGVSKFKSRDFSGFADSKIELTFKMNASKFFNYTGIRHIFNGNLSGTVKIYKKYGIFDIVSNNTKFTKNPLIKKIAYLTGVDLSKEKTGKVFLKGVFDRNKTVFDMLSTNQNISISIKKGTFVYPENYHIVVYLRKGNRVFKILLEKNSVKVIEKRNFRQTDNKILVF